MTVLRHELGVDIAQGAAEASAALVVSVEGLAGAEPGSPAQLRAVFDAALCASGFLAVRDSDSLELDRALRLAGQAGSAWFRCVAARPGAVVVARLGDTKHAFAGVGSQDDATVWHFREAAALAAITRDRGARRELGALPLTAVRVEVGPKTALGLLRVRAWQGLLQQAVGGDAVSLDWMGVLEAAYKAANAVRTRTSIDREVQGEIEAMRALALGDAREINRALTRMLDAFWRGYSVPDRRDDPRGFLALPVLAIGAVATDLGIRVELDSEYTPIRLLQGQFDELLADDGSTNERIVLCPFCGSSLPRRARACPRCTSDLSHIEPIVGDPVRIAGLERSPCAGCGEPMLVIAHCCAACLRWRDDSVGADEATDEVALRPFPPTYQAWLTARRSEPYRLWLPNPRVRGAEAPAVLRRSGLMAEVIPGVAGLVDVRLPSDVAAAGFEFVDGADGGLEVETTFGADPTRDLWRLLRVVQALAGASGAVDPALGTSWPPDRLASIAEAPVPPEPEHLFDIAVHRAADDKRAWLATRGLSRCGVFELEMLDVPIADLEAFVALLRGVALRLVERDEGLWPEEVPFQVGEGVWVSWIPFEWARDDWPASYGCGAERASEARTLSGVIVASEPQGRREPIAALAARLREDPRLWASRLGIRRRRAVARVTWARLEALRRERPDDAVEVELLLGDDPAAAEDRRGLLVRRDSDRIVLRTEDGEASYPADSLVDWALVGGGPRIMAADVLLRRAGSGERAAAPRVAEPDEPTDPRIVDRAESEPEQTVVTGLNALPVADREDTTHPSIAVPLLPALSPLSVEATERLGTDGGDVTMVLGPRPLGAIALSFVVPGAGHWWVGERARAGWVFGAAVLTLGGCGLIGAWAAWDIWRRER